MRHRYSTPHTPHTMAAAGCLLTAAVVLIAGCGSDATAGGQAAGPDVSKTGRVDYACALAQDLPADGSVFDTSDAAASRELAGATRLLGAMTGSDVPGYESLSGTAQDAIGNVRTIRIDGVNDAIAALADDCAGRGLPHGQPDISQPGRVDYACGLAASARAGDYPLDTSNFDVRGQVDPTLTAAASASGLLAGAGGQVGGGGQASVPGRDELTQPAFGIYQAITTVDVERLNSSIDTLATACA